MKLRLRSATGAAIDTAEADFDRFRFSASPQDLGGSPGVKDGVLEIPGVEPGVHRLLIAAPGHLARVQQIVLREDEVRTIDAVLTPRP